MHGNLLWSSLDVGMRILHLTVFYHAKTKDSPKILKRSSFPIVLKLGTHFRDKFSY